MTSGRSGGQGDGQNDHDDHEPPEREPPGRVPPTFDPPALARTLPTRLLGASADGSTLPAGAAPAAAVWVDGGDEVLVHLDSLQVRVLDGAVVASLDLETDQTGRAPVVVRFALAGKDTTAGLIGVTDELAGGHPVLAARWGAAVQEAVWASLLGLVADHAGQQGQVPHGISAVAGTLRLHLGAPFEIGPGTKT